MQPFPPFIYARRIHKQENIHGFFLYKIIICTLRQESSLHLRLCPSRYIGFENFGTFPYIGAGKHRLHQNTLTYFIGFHFKGNGCFPYFFQLPKHAPVEMHQINNEVAVILAFMKSIIYHVGHIFIFHKPIPR